MEDRRDPGAATAAPVPTPVPSTSVPREVLPTEMATPEPLDSENDRDIASCVGIARQEQLSSYVASPALLFISDPRGGAVPGFALSSANTAKIIVVAALVLALTVGASILAGARLVRPLHALTGAAQRMRDGEEPSHVVVAADNEIGRLAAAFNDMSVHRARLEEQRKVMVSDVAHELRTPLSNIRGWLEGAQDGIADVDAVFVSSLLEEAVQVQHIIDDLQDLAAADAGACVCTPSPYGSRSCSPTPWRPIRRRPTPPGVALTVTVADGDAPAPETQRRPRPVAAGDRQPRLQRRTPHPQGRAR